MLAASVFSRRARAMLLGVILTMCTFTASAQTPPYVFEDYVRIGIEASGTSPAAGQCLIRGENGTGNFVRYLWPGGPQRWCGFPSEAAFRANRQGVFEVVYINSEAGSGEHLYLLWQGHDTCLVANRDGTTGFADCARALASGDGMWRIDASVRVGKTIYASIRSMLTDQCLIFSNNGNDVRPTLYRWGNVPADSRYCGLGIDALMQTGQGLFTFTPVR